MAGRSQWLTAAPVYAVVAIAVMASNALFVSAQLKFGSPLFWQALEERSEDQEALLRDHPDLVAVYNPAKFLIDRDQYEFLDPAVAPYRSSVIVEPCLNHAYDCCNDTYGTPQYGLEVTNTGSEDFGDIVAYKADGTQLTEEASRRPDEEVVFDEECEDLSTPTFACLGLRARRQPYRVFPVCWDRNESVDATAPCRAPLDGHMIPRCVQIAYTQTAFITECSHQYKDDPHCGTYLEVHKPDDEEPLAVTKLRGQFTSGYRMSLLSTTYKGRLDRLLCRGEHEIWWVQRTRYNFVVENKKKFFISAPECDWDFTNEQYFRYATLRNVDWELYEETPVRGDNSLLGVITGERTGQPVHEDVP